MVKASAVAMFEPIMCRVVSTPAKNAAGTNAAIAQPVMHTTTTAASWCHGDRRCRRSTTTARASIADHSGTSQNRPSIDGMTPSTELMICTRFSSEPGGSLEPGA